MRQIKFRAWDKEKKKWIDSFDITNVGEILSVGYSSLGEPFSKLDGLVEIMQFTGLLDKNSLKEVYEGDIIDVNGNIKSNIYEIKELDKDRYDHVICGFGTKDWLTTYKIAVDRGCKDSE